MNNRPDTDLDTFEAALLTELRGAVGQAATAASQDHRVPARAPHPRHRRRWQVLVGAMAAAALGVALLVPNLGPTPAYAVTGRNNEEVRVKVNRLEGAGGLEQALRERGIRADVTYLPTDKQCAPGRYSDVGPTGLILSVSADRFEVRIPPNAVGNDDTFVLSAAVMPIPDGAQVIVDFGIAHGPVAPCRVIDGP